MYHGMFSGNESIPLTFLNGCGLAGGKLDVCFCENMKHKWTTLKSRLNSFGTINRPYLSGHQTIGLVDPRRHGGQRHVRLEVAVGLAGLVQGTVRLALGRIIDERRLVADVR